MTLRKIGQWHKKYDAVNAAPNSHKILLENEKVRVIEVVIKAGEKEPMHHHKWPSIMIVDKATNLRYYDKENKTIDIYNNEARVEWMDPELLHAVENISKKEYHAIRIEIKQ